MSKLIDMTGRVCGKLTVLKRWPSNNDHRTGAVWLCQCVCSRQSIIRGDHLRKGHSKSCHHHLCWEGRTVPTPYWTRLKQNAKIRQISLSITKEQAWEKFQGQRSRCALTDLDITFGRGKETTASLDRIDSSKGYTIDNTQWVHKDINNMKMALAQDRFLDLCRLVTRQQTYLKELRV